MLQTFQRHFTRHTCSAPSAGWRLTVKHHRRSGVAHAALGHALVAVHVAVAAARPAPVLAARVVGQLRPARVHQVVVEERHLAMHGATTSERRCERDARFARLRESTCQPPPPPRVGQQLPAKRSHNGTDTACLRLQACIRKRTRRTLGFYYWVAIENNNTKHHKLFMTCKLT